MVEHDVLNRLVNQAWSEGSFAARAQASDALRPFPLVDPLESITVPEALGPWRIAHSGDDFEWRLTDSPSINDRGAWELGRQTLHGDKQDRIRVVLVGESAAGSFGYWEASTLARQLECKLRRIDERFEVIDLSCVNASMALCLEIMKCAATLDPDYFVLYGANNEGKSLLDQIDSGQLNASTPSALRWDFLAGSLQDYGPSMVGALASHCTNQLARARRIAEHLEAQLLYILPESNSVDWVPQEDIGFSLTGRQALERARRPRDGSLPADGGSQHELWHAARAVRQTNPARARHLFDAAREAGIGAFVNAVPQTVSTVAEALRGTCRDLGIPCLDMPALFRGEGRWADRTRFIDYCHLSLDGLDEVASAGAAKLLVMQGLPHDEARVRQPVTTSARERSLGALVGAVHNYHYGQPRDIVSHWVDQALQAGWVHLESLLDGLREFLLERPREIFTPQRLDRHPGFRDLPDRYRLFFLKFAYHGRFDRQLVEVLDECQRRSTLPKLVAKRQDDLLAFQGDLCSLFYLDCQQGVKPRLRGANRTGWERPDLEFIVTAPSFSVDIPPTRWQYDAIEIELDIDAPVSGSLGFQLEGDPMASLPLQPGRTVYRFAMAADGQRLRRARFTVDHMVGLADLHGVRQRYRHLGRFGWYPCGGRVVGLRLAPAASPWGEARA